MKGELTWTDIIMYTEEDFMSEFTNRQHDSIEGLPIKFKLITFAEYIDTYIGKWNMI
jgi:hypothetical protein